MVTKLLINAILLIILGWMLVLSVVGLDVLDFAYRVIEEMQRNPRR